MIFLKGEYMSTRATNSKLIHAFEHLEAIEKAEGDEKLALLKQYGAESPLNYLISLNFSKTLQLDLPEGMPPTKKLDDQTHPDMMHPLRTQIQKIRNCFPDVAISKLKKEKIFIDILENVAYKEAVILVHCKDKALEEVYPSITAELVEEAFPGTTL